MTEANYAKIDIATEYLNVAASFWLSNINLFSSAHLAGAAEEISGQHCRLKGLESRRDWWVSYGDRFIGSEVFPEITGKKLANMAYLPKNSIKHMNLSEVDSTVAIDIREVSSNLIRAAFSNFETLDLCSLLSDEVYEVIKKTTIYLDTNS